MRPKMPILLYCADRELLSATAFALRLQPYDVTAIDDSRSAAAVMMASHLVCGILIHAKQGDPAGRLIHRLLETDLRVPLLLVDRAGDLDWLQLGLERPRKGTFDHPLEPVLKALQDSHGGALLSLPYPIVSAMWDSLRTC